MLLPDQVLDLVNNHASYLAHNEQLIDIYEGSLLKHLEKDMAEQFSLQMFMQAKMRTVPINVLPKIIDKLTNIYQGVVTRHVQDGSDQDAELLAWYADKMRIDVAMNSANELFNLCRSSLIHPYVHNYKPCLRVILNDRFVVYSEDEVHPNIPTHVILLAGKREDKSIYWVYSDKEFYIMDSRGEMRRDLMLEYNNEEGINPIGRLPFVYINESRYRLCPKIDTDVLKLTKIIPIMLTDLNVAAMFQAFSILYGIDLDDENLKIAPNVFWRLKSDPMSDKKPEIGMLKPEVDFEQVMRLIESQLSMWMGTKGIRASSIGSLSTENFASGISKIIDEMDTYEAREKQVTYFEDAESELWDLILKYMHPYWRDSGEIENKAVFTPSATVSTSFAVQLAMQSRGILVKDLRDEYAAGFTSRKRALMKLNPELSEADIDELILEIDEERGITQEGTDDAGEVAEDQPADTSGPKASAEVGAG
jgi:hypothetical protein